MSKISLKLICGIAIGKNSTRINVREFALGTEGEKTALNASNEYYLNLNPSNTRADIFLSHIPYTTVEEKITKELNANLETIKSTLPDTYNFVKSLGDRCMEMSSYQ